MAINLNVTYGGNTLVTLENQSSVPITYNSATATMTEAGVWTLPCANKLMATNLGVGNKTLACGGKVMSSNIVLTAESASTELYLIKNGIVQSGFTFTGAGKRYDTGNTVTPSITYESTGGGRIAALSNTVTNRKGSIYYSNSLASIISNYTMWHVRCLRYLRSNTNAKINIGTYVEAGSTSYAPNNFKDYIYKSTTSDSDVVLVENAMTSASYVNNVCFAFAWSVPSNGSNYGVYIYDVWLT